MLYTSIKKATRLITVLKEKIEIMEEKLRNVK